MSREDQDRLSDIAVAITAIRDHLTRGDVRDGLAYDAVRVRLIEIGEAVKGIGDDLLELARVSRGRRSPACAITWLTATSTPTTLLCRTSSTTSSNHWATLSNH